MDPQVSTLNPAGVATPGARRRMALSASNSVSKAFTSAGVAACSFTPPAPVLVDRGFHGFHVPGASGSDRDCDKTGMVPPRPARRTSTPSQRWGVEYMSKIVIGPRVAGPSADA